jgi:Na+-translocating ferredoxin:NAD+ oxidoreductase RnfD subunit
MSEREGLYGSFAPLLLGLATLALWFGFQTTQLLKERDNLNTLRNNQTTIYTTAQKMRTQLDAIAAETARLAQAGNPHATEIVNALKARGITIDPNAAQKPAQKPVGK